jgi:transcriptional regulator with XRE-family HTH domain
MTKSRNEVSGVGDRLKKIRGKFNYSTREMASVLEMSYDGYFKNETNMTYPRPTTLSLLQQKFDVSMDWLLLGKGPVFFKDKPQPVETFLANPNNASDLMELLETIEQDPQLKHEILAYFYKYKNNKNIEK